MLLLVSTGLQIFLTLYTIFEWKYPCIYDLSWAVLAYAILLIPILAVWPWIIYSIIKKKKYPKGAGLLSVVLVLFFLLPSLFVGVATPVYSRTTNINNYLEVDSYVDKDKFLEELFPDEIPMKSGQEKEEIINTNPCYFYQCMGDFDISSDIYAEWTLSKEDFDLEVSRSKALFVHNDYPTAYECMQIQHGDYQCKIRYYSMYGTEEFDPFVAAEQNYTVYMFAYNEKTNQVRYIYSNSDGAHEPYYMSLVWE